MLEIPLYSSHYSRAIRHASELSGLPHDAVSICLVIFFSGSPTDVSQKGIVDDLHVCIFTNHNNNQ